MKQKLEYTQKLNQTLQLSLNMKKSLDVLKMNQSDLLECIQEIVDHNPIISYTPSTDIHQYLMETATVKTTLKDDLYLQLHTAKQKYDIKAAEFIIESLDEHGFFTIDLSTAAQLSSCTIKQLQTTLSLIQSFDPAGVATADSIQAIANQLHRQYLFDAEHILLHEQEAMLKKDYRSIAKHMQLSLEEVMGYLDDIKECTPFPCSNYAESQEALILPDFEIKVSQGEIEIIPKQVGHIYIEDELEVLKTNQSLKPYFEDAYYFIDSISKRNKTMLLMANELIHIQKNYFLFHDELKPCTLMDIAKACGFHESTVSRTLSNKYYLFQGEIYPLKQLFVSATKEGSSKDSIQKAILALIKEEDKTKPYADYELVEKLEEMELYVSRRAIAKYRTQLHIPSSKERKVKSQQS